MNQLPNLLKSWRRLLFLIGVGALTLSSCMTGGDQLRLVLPVEDGAAEPLQRQSEPSETVTFAPDAISLTLEEIVDGLATPVYVTHAGDDSGRLFVLEKAGTIRVIMDGQLLPAPFLDIREQVTTGGNEQGLLGLAFAPDYAASGYFFVNYNNLDGDTVIARFQHMATDPNRADATSEFLILQIDQPARNHNGGMVTFGPDGYLYIGMGDGGGSGDRYGHGQNPRSLLGKMLRIDVTTDPTQPYLIPPDNPWVTVDWNGTDVRDEIWAVGLRNPWRYSFDRVTGDLWIGDVGQNQYEEINMTQASTAGGLNYGWPIMEGSHCFRSDECSTDGLILPVADYAHRGHCSVTGGHVYRGTAMPTLSGVYLFGDYCSGTIWATWPTAGTWQTSEILESNVRLSSFGEDERGELYLTDMSGGRLLRLTAGS